SVFRLLFAAFVPWMAVTSSKRVHAQPTLSGHTVDFAYGPAQGADENHAWTGRAYIHASMLHQPDQPFPLVVFLHGINKRQVPHPFMGAPGMPDLRFCWDRALADHRFFPCVIAAPSSTSACKLPQALWGDFDLDHFLAYTLRATRDQVRIDLSRVVVVGHSGAGCNPRGGLVTAMQSTLPLVGGLVVDVCMDRLDAQPLARARSDMDVVITYQRKWRRDFSEFSALFQEQSQGAQGLRLVQELPILSAQPHTDILLESLFTWLPRWLPPTEVHSPVAADSKER
ncbi:MAG TPA: hypothetical protein PKW66_03560, partial [Polyangiaceae bacterium]|nr:hypothetical protein [Polyangiaceae bacterium]